MASQTQIAPPKVVSFRDWTVASYQASTAELSDGSADEDDIDEMLLRDVTRYEAYLAEMGAQAEINEFQALSASVRCRPYQFVPSTRERPQNDFVLLFTVEEEMNWNYAICFSMYAAVMNTAHSQTWTASIAHAEARIEADRRELYGLPREWDTINGIDHQDPRTVRLLLELLISEAEKSDSEQARVAVLDICRPQRQVLRIAVATESRLTEAQSNTTNAVLDEAHRIIGRYQLDNAPQVPVERDPPLEPWEWRALARNAEIEWREENESHLTRQELAEELRERLAQQIEEDYLSDDELEDENSRIRTSPHYLDFDGLHLGHFHDPNRSIELDQNGDPIDDDELEDADESQYEDDSDDNSYSSEFCSEGVRGCDCDCY
ncbi:hypothetical protein DL98DRAFT_535104 [Cadophora sp. DSE1049]|nr:hypothetical protein DL98DRAFT_535104 [Cadophora sp. DSE1049]